MNRLVLTHRRCAAAVCEYSVVDYSCAGNPTAFPSRHRFACSGRASFVSAGTATAVTFLSVTLAHVIVAQEIIGFLSVTERCDAYVVAPLSNKAHAMVFLSSLLS